MWFTPYNYALLPSWKSLLDTYPIWARNQLPVHQQLHDLIECLFAQACRSRGSTPSNGPRLPCQFSQTPFLDPVNPLGPIRGRPKSTHNTHCVGSVFLIASIFDPVELCRLLLDVHIKIFVLLFPRELTVAAQQKFHVVPHKLGDDTCPAQHWSLLVFWFLLLVSCCSECVRQDSECALE